MNIENLNKICRLVSMCFTANWPSNVHSRTSDLKLECYLRNASIVGWDFCLVRQDHSATTIYAKPSDHL